MARKLPQDFLLGAATSSFQIEGSLEAEGRSASIWDHFPVQNQDSGAQACDHYRRYPEDVALMKSLGLGAYRFSIAWSRVHPAADRKLNRAGLDFYDRLVDELLAAGIQPWATLHHWDLPMWLQNSGGWESRQSVSAFRAYCADCVRVLGDRVRNWFTINEPWCIAVLGHQTGEHAPGLRLPRRGVLAVIHHLLLAHGTAVRTLREHDSGLRVGPVLNPWIPLPLTGSELDLRAAEAAWSEHVGWWFEPLYHARYPEPVSQAWEEDLPALEESDMALISTPCDFLGLNLYFPGWVRHAPERDPFFYEECGALVDLPRTEMGWQVYPPFLHYALERIHRLYQPGPLYMTENGCATADRLDDRGQVHDLWRKEYLRTHLEQLLELRAQGVPVEGYFAWSLLDNFEWQYGYSKRFGLIWVDYQTQERRLKASARWYAAVARDRLLHSSHLF